MYLVLFASATVGYLSFFAVYRLFFSPIAQFPGPKLAALSRWYEFYYEVILRGQLTFHIAELHRKSGKEKIIGRLNDEAQLLVAAGLTTTAWAMSVTAIYIIESKSIVQELRRELITTLPDAKVDKFDWVDVEKLPYLNACIWEGLQLSYGVTARSPRLWDKSLQYQGWTIPGRTPVGLTIVDHDHNEASFPRSHEYMPERWLEKDERGEWRLNKNMDRWSFPFGKGSRSCLGVNLATAEMHLCLATLLRKYDFELYETDKLDVTLAHDFFLPSARLDSKGVRVTAKEVGT